MVHVRSLLLHALLLVVGPQAGPVTGCPCACGDIWPCLVPPCLPADNNLESLFNEELKRRGLDSLDDVGGWTPADEGEQPSTLSSSSTPACCQVRHA